MKGIEIPFRAKDSELGGWEYTIPEGMEAVVEGGKVIVRRKESEDERIIDDAIQIIRASLLRYAEYCPEADKHRKALDYLEKQKEQKPGTEETELNSIAFLEQLGYTCIPPGAEQKPAEWSEEDEYNLAWIIETLYGLEGNDKNFEKECKRKSVWLKSLPERFNLQSKQDWNEEDEEHLDSIIESYKELLKDYSANNGVDYIPYNTPVVARTVLNDIKFLKSLRPQPKQEWGEKDEENFKWFDKFFRAESIVVGGRDIPQDKYLWFKSLRPQHHKWYIKKGHWYVCIVDKPEYGWTKGKVYQSPKDNRIETDYKGNLTNWPDSEPWFRPATREEIPDSQPHWKPSVEQMAALYTAAREAPIIKEGGNYLYDLYNDLEKLL